MSINIINDDCSKPEVVNKFLDKQFDIIFTSPPYNNKTSKNSFGGQKYITKSYDFNKEYGVWLLDIIKKWLPKCKYFFLNIQENESNKKDLIYIMDQLKEYYVDRLYWVKPSAIPQVVNNCLTNCVEWVLIFTDMKHSKSINTGKQIGYVQNVMKIGANQKNKYKDIHKAVMNKEVSDYIIKTFLNCGSNVLDIFGGVGTTALSCKENNINCTLIEIEKQYCDVAQERISNLNVTENKKESI